MFIENVALKNRFSLDFFDKSGNWNKFSDLELKKCGAYISKIIYLSNLKDLVWKLKPRIYDMFSCLQNGDKNLEKLTTYNPASVAVSSTDFLLEFIFSIKKWKERNASYLIIKKVN